MVIELFPLTLKSLETISMALVGAGAFFYYTWKKIQDIRGKKSEAKPNNEFHLIDSVMVERDAALRQRDDAMHIADSLKAMNDELRDKMRDLVDEIENMKNKLSLISELNRRLAQSLDIHRQLQDSHDFQPSPDATGGQSESVQP